VLAGILAKCTANFGWVRLLLQLLDLLPLADRLAMHGVLKPFDHCFEVPEARLDGIETLRYARFLPVGVPHQGSSPFEPPSQASRPQSW
jgi:hypothetical protein